eukprot:TRINITY_DN19819_c0_g1_i7.p1 TRINITY_DN19819_c0_g1~~TRINITY_DN19819_c0_g1_i7.p1  ORF type:complete len:165 (-),score=43.88 TRINITY_DN19819_c0_g1_i7:72-566(-)
MFLFFFFIATATTEIYTRSIVGSVRCVQETGYQRRVHGAFENYLKQEAQPDLRPATGLSNDSRNNYHKKGLFLNYRSNSGQLQDKQRVPSAGKKIPSFLRSTLHFGSPLSPTGDLLKSSNILGKTFSPSEDKKGDRVVNLAKICLLYTSPSPRDLSTSRMPSSA